jgi:hypothetical protein
MKPRPIFLAFLILALLLALFGSAQAAPQAVGAGDVLAAVNELRRSQGLSPYSADGGIAAYAQEHSEYQARIDQWTHTHSDGSTAGSRGYVENVAAGNPSYLTSQSIVYEIWADAIHMKTMVGYASGSAGVGVASNGSTVYVTLNVLPGNAVAVPTLPGGTPGSGFVYTPIALVPLRTATPKPSGAVIHDVGYGQSLWAIAMAYGVPGVRIRELNGMAAGQNDIYAGQRLLIIPAGSITPPAQVTEAAAAPEVTPSPFITPTRYPTRTPLPTGAPSPTAGPTSNGVRSLKGLDPVLAGLIGMALLGLALFLVSGVKVNRKA